MDGFIRVTCPKCHRSGTVQGSSALIQGTPLRCAACNHLYHYEEADTYAIVHIVSQPSPFRKSLTRSSDSQIGRATARDIPPGPVEPSGRPPVLKSVAPENPTAVSLLERLQRSRSDGAAWKRFGDIYLPLIRRWIGCIPGMENEIEDLSQDVLLVLVRKIPEFQRGHAGSFRAWLRQITTKCVRASLTYGQIRSAVGIDQITEYLDRMADSSSDLSKRLDVEHDLHVLDSLVTTVHDEFDADTWAAFQQFALAGRPAAEVGRQLGMTENGVVKARMRVLARLREEARGFIN